MKYLLHLFILCLFFPNVAFSDTVISKDGDKLNGTLISFSQITCIFAPMIAANHVEIEWKNVKSLQSDSEFIIDLDGGDRVSGKISFTQKKGLEVSSLQNRANINLAHLKSVSQIHTDIHSNEQNIKKSSVEIETISPIPPMQNHSERYLNPIGHSGEITFGEEQEEPPLTFLRGSTVQLAPGEIEGRILFSYQPNHQTSVIGDNQIRIFTTGLSFNVGLHDRVEGFINIPISYVKAREGNLLESSRDTDFSLGDIVFGSTTLLKPETISWPEIDLHLSVTAPTGNSPYEGNLAYTGNGHWVADVGLNFIRSTEPAILFGGISAGYIFSTTEHAVKYKYGWKADYHFGLGFAINDTLSVSSVLQGGYRPPRLIDGDSYNTFSQDPLNLSFSMAYRLNSNIVVEPSVGFGLNEDAGSSMFSLGFSRKFN